MNDLTLASVEEAFEQWREHRSSRKELIPEKLWSMALALYPQYMRSKICHQLRLSGRQFKRRLENNGETSRTKRFVLASRDEVKEKPAPITEIQLTLQGQVRSMMLCFDSHALGHVLSHVGAL